MSLHVTLNFFCKNIKKLTRLLRMAKPHMLTLIMRDYTGILSEIRTKLRDWAIWQGRAGFYNQAALSSKRLYL